jgi:hypothetical protein
MDTNERKCTRCGSTDLRATYVKSRAYSTDFLPGVLGPFSSARFRICVCPECGLVEWNVPANYLPKIKKNWARESDI